jgi:hypothetical protein
MAVPGSIRRRAVGADVPVRSFGRRRVCEAPGCEVLLSSYNPARRRMLPGTVMRKVFRDQTKGKPRA